MIAFPHGPTLVLTQFYQHSCGFKKAEEEANQEAEEKLKEIKAAGKKSGDKVVADLVKATTDVKPQVSEKIVAKV